MALALTVLLFLPTFPHTYRFLKPRQREVAIARMAGQNTSEVNAGIDKRALKHAFMDWKTYAFALM